VTLLVYAEAYTEATAFLDEAVAESVARGSALGFIGASAGLSLLHARTGALVEAEADARAAIDAAQLNSWPAWHVHTRTLLAGALLERGDLRAASGELAGTEPPAGLALGTQETVLLETRGRLRLALGETEAAVADLLECGRRFERWGLLNPAAFAWRSGAALGLARLGSAHERERAAALADEEVARARRWGSPRALGVALRGRGVVAGGEAELVLLAEAASALARSAARVEHARALTDLGAALRRAQRRTDARAPLREALELAHACGAVALAERARTELAAAGARPRTPWRTGVDALTPSERRIAGMAASGLGNPAIAQALFVTVKTIEMHLTSTYRKLDISSRAALAAAIAE
jgi:DNA-binding CsgD family transcriptional regulator